MADGWNDTLLHLVNTGLSTSAGFGIATLYERWKKIRLTADDWQLWCNYRDAEGGNVAVPVPPDVPIDHIAYGFTARFFSEKPRP